MNWFIYINVPSYFQCVSFIWRADVLYFYLELQFWEKLLMCQVEVIPLYCLMSGSYEEWLQKKFVKLIRKIIWVFQWRRMWWICKYRSSLVQDIEQNVFIFPSFFSSLLKYRELGPFYLTIGQNLYLEVSNFIKQLL